MPELANPLGLLWLAAVPLLLLPYLLRQRPRRRMVPALFLFAGIERAERMRLGGRLRLRPLFLLQLGLLLLAIAALVRPALRAADTRAAIVLDNSASLRTVDGSGKSRFASAVDRARASVSQSAASRWDVFVLSPMPHDVGTDLTPGEARARLAALEPGTCGHPDDSQLRSFFDRLSRAGYASVDVVTDRRAATTGRFRVTSVGVPVGNVAITDLTVVPSAVAGRPASLDVVVENFSGGTARVPLEISDAEHGTSIRTTKLDVAPHGSASFSADVPAAQRLVARIDARDALAFDDEATVSTPETSRSILVVGNGGLGLDSVAKLLGARLEVVSADRYRPDMAHGRDLVVFHRSAPKEPPDAPALYLLPPDAPFLPASGPRVDSPVIAFPLATHPVARYLNPAALRPRQALALRSAAGFEPIAVTEAGPIIAVRAGPVPAVVSGLDLLPYLGDRNRPVSILTLNLFSWMFRGSRPEANRCVPIGRLESDLEHPGTLPLPAESAAPRIGERSRPLWPALTLAALAILAVEAWFHRAGGGLSWVMRIAAAALFVAAWLDPMRAVAGSPPAPLAIVDVSKSVTEATRSRGLAELGLSPGDPAVVFASRPVPTTLSLIGSSTASAGPDETDLEAALLTAVDKAPEDGAAFLVTDGWETRGDAKRAIEALSRRRVHVYPVTESQSLGNDVEVRSLSLPAAAAAGSARAEVVVQNDNPTAVGGRITVRQGTKRLLDETVRLPPGESVTARPVLLAGEGLLELVAEFQPSDASTDRDRTNDVAKAWVTIGGGKRVLLIGHDPRDNRSLEHALTQRGVRVTAVAHSAGDRVPAPAGFAAVILNDVPIGDLPGEYPDELRAAVAGGAGLAMVGGPRSFGLGGYRGSAIEEALPVRMKERAREEPTNAVALVIDKSGSMREEHRITFAREAARQLVEHLKDRDRIAVIGFDREPFLIVPLSDVGEIRDDFERQIDRLKPSGGTRLFPALEEARRQLLGQEAKRRHVIVLSDGLSEDAESSYGRRSYYDLALALAEQGVTISTIALGRDADTDFLERLASFGRGAFHATADASSLPEIVLGEFESHGREKTLVEREFHPEPSRESPLVGEIARANSSWPAVSGLVETELKPRARRDVGVAESAAPLIASWEYERGRAVAVTTDADGRWSDRWLRWGEWSRLWGDVVRWLAPAARMPAPRFALAYRGGILEIDYSRFDEDPGGGASAKITPPGGRTQEVSLERRAPGHYHGGFATRSPGDYRIEIRGTHGAVTDTPLGFTIPAAETVEAPRREPNWALLETIARQTGGEINPTASTIRPAPAPRQGTPLAPWLLPAAMLIFVAELVVRRLRS